MAISSATSIASSALYARMQQQQAQRTADAAEQNARVLQQKAREAETEAVRAQDRAREVKGEYSQAAQGADSARQTLAAMKSVDHMKYGLSQGLDKVVQGLAAASGNDSQPSAPAASALTSSLSSGTASPTLGANIDVTA